MTFYRGIKTQEEEEEEKAMVIIEPAALEDYPKPEEDEGIKKTSNCSDASKSLDPGIDGGERRDPDVIGHRKPEDDDWETASEGDGDDEGDGVRSSRGSKPQESFEDAMTEEEQTQRALSQANASKSEGNQLYAARKYDEALLCYKTALEVAPEEESSKEIRSMCYSNSAMCYLQLSQYKEAVEQSTKALELNPAYVKALVRRAEAHEKLDQLDEALTDYKKVVELNPGNQQAIASAMRLEPIVAERREKLKEEMLGKLKDLGNSVLGRFGMSVDNFKAVKDPNTGSYSISFQK